MRADFGEDIVMTNEEAINYLKHNCRKMCQDCYPEIGRGGSENCDFCNEAGAYDTAIVALEKQIPKHVITKYDNYLAVPRHNIAECPCCGVHFRLDDNIGDSYCYKCGQKLEW